MFFMVYYLGLSDLLNEGTNLKQNNGAEYPINISSQMTCSHIRANDR